MPSPLDLLCRVLIVLLICMAFIIFFLIARYIQGG